MGDTTDLIVFMPDALGSILVSYKHTPTAKGRKEG